MVRRTSRCAEALHLLNEERQQCALVLDSSLGHRIEICLVGRATALSHHYKTILVALYSLDVNLCREVAACVHLVVHVERSVLRVAQVVLCESVVNTARESLFVLEVSPYALSLLAVDDGSTGVLAERQDTLAGCLGVAKELQSNVLVVLRSLRVRQNLSNLQVVFAAQHEFYVVESLLCEQCQSLLRNFQDCLAFKLTGAHAFLAEQAVFSSILAQLEHRSILEIWC